MKNFISSLILSVVLLPVLAQNTPITIYYSTVKMPASMWPEYYRSMDTKIVAEDMAQLLSEACNTTIKTAAYQNQSGNGIYLLLDDALKLTGNESSIINSDGKTQLTIKARFVTGLSYGVYTYLDQLGFRFYLPGKQWNYIPAIKSPITTPFKNTVFKPSFKLRMFTPSGAMPRVKGLDENGRLQKEWHEWYRRNRMGADYLTLGGHIGEMFNAAHQADIEKDPKILAPIKEKRGYDMGGKIDPTYPKGIQLFGDYITKQYQ
ncbi:MAG: hypothetical protein ACOYKE_10380, partial [Ferruginibacter sp.]